MLMIVGAIVGAVLGARTAKSRGGQALDMAQYAAGYAIAFTLLAWFLTLLINGLA